MKKFIYFIFAGFLALVSCSADEAVGSVVSGDGYLQSIILTAKNEQYVGRIKGNIISVANIEYGIDVSKVEVKLAPGAVLATDLDAYVGKWPRTLTMTVKKGNDASQNYSLVLSDYKNLAPDEEDEDIIFFTDFDETDGKPDPNVWSLVKKGSRKGIWDYYMSESYEHAYVEDGNLIVKAVIESGEYLTGGVTTKNKLWFRNAKVEVSAKFVKTGMGSWPALWFMPQNPVYSGTWPDCGEIDLVEQLRNDPYVNHTVHNHYRNTLGYQLPNSGHAQADYNVGEYNVYGIDLAQEAIVFYVNGEETFRYENLHLDNESEMMQWPYNTDWYLNINQALGGAGTWAGPITDSDLPFIMAVDWIKVTPLK